MEVRKFEAFSIQDAVKLVKVEMGNEAVILSTKEKDVYSQEMKKNCRLYEVTAATNATSFNEGLNTAKRGTSTAKKVEFPKIASSDPVTIVKSKKEMPPNINPSTKSLAENLAKTLQKIPKKTAESVLADTNERAELFNHSEIKNNDIDSLKAELVRVRRELETLPQVDVTEQMQEIKYLLFDLIKDKFKKNIESTHPLITDISIRLRTAGVAETFITHLVNYLNNFTEVKTDEELKNSQEKLRDFYLNNSIRFIFKYLKTTGPFIANKQKIICLVGPTGVGKTTTLAKLGAKLKLNEKKSICFISMDSFRVAAADQLRVYSKILDCDFQDFSDPADLCNFINKNIHHDYFLIDTAGRSTRFQDQMDNLKKLSELPLPIEFHLVLSSTMKQRDLDENIKGFKALSPTSLIFTKLDESWAFGEILNSSLQSRVPLSYFTTGQRVPEDLEVATKERVVERLFKL